MTIPQREINQEKKTLTVVYILYALGLFSLGITAVVGYFIAKKNQSSYYVNHYNRLIQIFNKSGIYFLVGVFTAGMGVGFLILIFGLFFYYYSLYVGFTKLTKNLNTPVDVI